MKIYNLGEKLKFPAYRTKKGRQKFLAKLGEMLYRLKVGWTPLAYMTHKSENET